MRKNNGKTPVRQAAPKQTTGEKTASPSAGFRIPLSENAVLLLHVAALTLLLFLLRRMLIDVPLERDESAYAYLGKCAAEGLAPYRDFYEMKPPLLFYCYAVLVKTFGFSHHGVHWAAFFMSWLNAMALYAIGRQLLRPVYGLLAAAMFIIASSVPTTSGIFMGAELIEMAFVLWGVWFLLKALPVGKEGPASARWLLILSGALMASGMFVKQTAVFFLAFPALYLLAYQWQRGRPFGFKQLLVNGLYFSAGVLLVVLKNIFIIQAFGVWAEFKFWNIDYVNAYSTYVTDESAAKARESSLTLLYRNLEVYWWLAGLGFAALLLKVAPAAQRLGLAALALAAVASVLPGRRFYIHYFLQLWPVLTLLAAYLFFAIQMLLSRWMGKSAAIVSALACCICTLLPYLKMQAVWSRPNTANIMRSVAPGNPFAEEKPLSAFLAKRMKPDDQLAVLGSEPQFYVYLNKKAPSRHFYMAFMSRATEYSKQWQTEALDSLKAADPEYVVFVGNKYSWMLKPESDRTYYEESYKWMRANYDPVAWAVYEDSGPKIITDDSAAKMPVPRDKEFIGVMQHKQRVAAPQDTLPVQ